MDPPEGFDNPSGVSTPGGRINVPLPYRASSFGVGLRIGDAGGVQAGNSDNANGDGSASAPPLRDNNPNPRKELTTASAFRCEHLRTCFQVRLGYWN